MPTPVNEHTELARVKPNFKVVFKKKKKACRGSPALRKETQHVPSSKPKHFFKINVPL